MSRKLGVLAVIGLLLLMSHMALAAEIDPQGEATPVFDYTGTIDTISNSDIVLSDHLYKLASSLTLYTKDGAPAFPSSFKAGVTVDYHLDNLGQVDAMRLNK